MKIAPEVEELIMRLNNYSNSWYEITNWRQEQDTGLIRVAIRVQALALCEDIFLRSIGHDIFWSTRDTEESELDHNFMEELFLHCLYLVSKRNGARRSIQGARRSIQGENMEIKPEIGKCYRVKRLRDGIFYDAQYDCDENFRYVDEGEECFTEDMEIIGELTLAPQWNYNLDEAPEWKRVQVSAMNNYAPYVTMAIKDKHGGWEKANCGTYIQPYAWMPLAEPAEPKLTFVAGKFYRDKNGDVWRFNAHNESLLSFSSVMSGATTALSSKNAQEYFICEVISEFKDA